MGKEQSRRDELLSIVLDFDKLELDGVRCREHGSLTLIEPAGVAPIHSADPRKPK